MLEFVELRPCTSEDYFENLISLVAMSSELKLYKALVFINQKAFLNNEQLAELFKFSLYKKQPILFVENTHLRDKIVNENKLYVDCEFFEFLI